MGEPRPTSDPLVACLARIIRAIAEREATQRPTTMTVVELRKRGGRSA